MKNRGVSMNLQLHTLLTNGVAERKNHTLIEMARMMFDKYKTPYTLFPYPLKRSTSSSIVIALNFFG